MATVLVLGSTGFVGGAVAARLIEAGHQVRILVRDLARAADLIARGAVPVTGDATDAAALASACAGAEHVVSLVAVRRNHPQSYLAVNVDGPRRLGEAARAAGVTSVVFVSAIGARLEPRLRYLTSRWMGEDQLKKSGVPVTILRFSFVIAAAGGIVDDFERATALPVLVIPGRGDSRHQPILRDDVAGCVSAAVGRSDLYGRGLDLGGTEILTYNQLFDLFLVARGIRKPKLHVPVPLLMPGAILMEALLPNPLVVPDELRTIQGDSIADSLESVSSTFGFRPGSPIAWIAENWKQPAPA